MPATFQQCSCFTTADQKRSAGFPENFKAVTDSASAPQYNHAEDHIPHKVRIHEFVCTPSTFEFGLTMCLILTSPHTHDTAVCHIKLVCRPSQAQLNCDSTCSLVTPLHEVKNLIHCHSDCNPALQAAAKENQASTCRRCRHLRCRSAADNARAACSGLRPLALYKCLTLTGRPPLAKNEYIIAFTLVLAEL